MLNTVKNTEETKSTKYIAVSVADHNMNVEILYDSDGNALFENKDEAWKAIDKDILSCVNDTGFEDDEVESIEDLLAHGYDGLQLENGFQLFFGSMYDPESTMRIWQIKEINV